MQPVELGWPTLSGATQGVGFPHHDVLGACVQWLIYDGHGHHFAVLGEGTELWCSPMAIGCLVEAGLLPPEFRGLLPDDMTKGHQDAVVAQEGARARRGVHEDAGEGRVGRFDDP